jgi:thioredoxin-like negative regulator of GroEL
LALLPPAEAVQRFKQALALAPDHPAALLGASEALLVAGHLHGRQGALGAAAAQLQEAAALARTCVQHHGQLQSSWKLLGDCELQQAVVAPLAAAEQVGSVRCCGWW